MKTLLLITILILPVSPATADEMKQPARFGHEAVLPVASLFLPGLGQAANGAWPEAFGFLGAAMGGLAIASAGESSSSDDRFPRDPNEQQYSVGLSIYSTAAFMSAFDSFGRSLPKLREGGHYDFLTDHTRTRDAFAAPFKFHFLKRKTTWIPLLIPIGLATAYAIEQSDKELLPFEFHDLAYSTAISYGAGVGEEGAFRGWLQPWFHAMAGERSWISNPLQGVLFAAAHYPAVEVPVAQLIAGLYWGWLTERNGWDIQESIFQHMWYDAILISASLAFDDGEDARISLSLPTIRF